MGKRLLKRFDVNVYRKRLACLLYYHDKTKHDNHVESDHEDVGIYCTKYAAE